MTEPQVLSPKPGSIYYGLDNSIDHPSVNGDPFFGVYTKRSDGSGKFVTADDFSWKADSNFTGGRVAEKYLKVLEPQDLSAIRDSLVSHSVLTMNASFVRAILNTPEAFSKVSKAEFAKAYLDGIQAPQAAPMAALSGMAHLASVKHKQLHPEEQTRATEMIRIAAIYYGVDDHTRPKKLCISSQEFRIGAFEANPLTADEIKAIPYLGGALREVYELSGQDHSIHASSVVKKMQDAGFNDVASEMVARHDLELKMSKPVRKHDLDDGPGL